MASDETDKTDETPCDNRDNCDTARPSDAEIRAALALVAPDLAGGLRQYEALCPGWYWLTALGFDGALTDEAADRLVFRARGLRAGPEWMVAPDPWAFDAACWAAGAAIRSGADLPTPLRAFAADVMQGAITRPKTIGAPRKTKTADLHCAVLALALAGLGWCPLAENTGRKPGARPRVNAARLVAEAMGSTPEHVRALCVVNGYERLRQAIEAAGMVARAQGALRDALAHLRDKDDPPTV